MLSFLKYEEGKEREHCFPSIEKAYFFFKMKSEFWNLDKQELKNNHYFFWSRYYLFLFTFVWTNKQLEIRRGKPCHREEKKKNLSSLLPSAGNIVKCNRQPAFFSTL